MNNEYIRREDAVGAVEFGITLASAINIETGEWTELFQRENDELRKAVERIKGIEPADVVPVVRCKDCEHDISSQFDMAARCNLWGCLKPKRGFCDAGKRKERSEQDGRSKS